MEQDQNPSETRERGSDEVGYTLGDKVDDTVADEAREEMGDEMGIEGGGKHCGRRRNNEGAVMRESSAACQLTQLAEPREPIIVGGRMLRLAGENKAS